MVFHWRLSDSKSPQVSRTLLSILAVFNNDVVWMISTRPPTSKSSRPFNNPLVTVPKAPITIGIIVTFMFHSFFNSLARSRYLLSFHILLLLLLLNFQLYFQFLTVFQWIFTQDLAREKIIIIIYYFFWLEIFSWHWVFIKNIDRPIGRASLEYVDCTPCWGVRAPLSPIECLGYDSKVHLMVKLQYWRSGVCSVSLHCIPGPLWPKVTGLVRVPTMGQIELFKNYSYSIRLCKKKKNKKKKTHKKQLHKKCKYASTMNAIP